MPYKQVTRDTAYVHRFSWCIRKAKSELEQENKQKSLPAKLWPRPHDEYRQVETAFFSSFNSNRVSIVHTWNWVIWREVRWADSLVSCGRTHTYTHKHMRFQKTPDSCEQGLCIILLNTNDDYFSFIDLRLPLMDAVSSFTWSVQSNTKQLTEFGLDPLSQRWSSAILIQWNHCFKALLKKNQFVASFHHF